jgi:polyhydroxybutyrate depolymerase
MLILAALFVCAAAAAQTPPTPLPAGMTERVFPFDGAERRFLEFRPAAYMAGAPVLIVLHGGGQSARKMFRRPGSPHHSWVELAEREGFLLLAPNGTDPKSGDSAGENQHWYDLRNRWPVTNGPPDDVGFLAALAAWAAEERQADPARVYVAGASNGGMMTFRLLMERPDVFAAGAAFNATLPDRKLPEPASARPILITAGTEDPVIRWEGGELLKSGIVLRSAPDTLAFWLEVHGLQGTRPVTRYVLPDRAPDDGCRYEVAGWGGTPDAPLVEFWTIHGGGHWLPSNRPFAVTPRMLQWMGPHCLDVDGPAQAWAFFRKHRLP